MNQGQVNWNRGNSATAFEIQSLLPYTANLGTEEITWFDLQLGFLHNDAFPPQLSHRTQIFSRNLKIKYIAQSSCSVV